MMYMPANGAGRWLILLLIFLLEMQVGKSQADSIVIVRDTLAVSDTASILFYLNNQRNETNFFESKSAYYDEFNFDISERQKSPIAHTGNLGSSLQHLWYQPHRSIERFELLDPYKIYGYNNESFQYLKGPLDYSRVHYNQSLADQANLNVEAVALKNWSPHLSMTLHFNRISQTIGEFNHQGTRNSSIGLGFEYMNPNNRYTYSFLYIRNKYEQEFNWGFAERDEEGSIQQEINPLNYEVSSESAAGLYYHNDISYDHSFQFSKADSSKSQRFTLSIFHQIGYRNRVDHYYDSQPNSAIYDPYLNHPSGMRYWYHRRSLSNKLGIRLGNSGNLHFNTGVKHFYYDIDNDISVRAFQEYRYFASMYAKIGASQIRGEFEMPWQSDTQRLQAKVEAKSYLIEERIILKGGYELVMSALNPTENDLVITQQIVGDDKGFIRPIVHTFHAHFSFFRDRLELMGQYHLLEAPIYWDANLLPVQALGDHPVAKLGLLSKFHLWNFMLEPEVFYQTTPEFIDLPAWIVSMNMKYNQRMFQGNLLLTVGAEGRLFDTYQPNVFVPIFSQFALSDASGLVQSPDYPILDMYLGVSVSSFRFYTRIENILPRFNDQLPLAELVQSHPLYYNQIRLGIIWSFFN